MDATDLMLGDGRVGYLEYSEWKRARWAYDYADTFLQWLWSAGNVNFNVPDIRVDSSGTTGIGIPATTLAADEIHRIIRELDRWPHLETAARDKFGASLCIDLGREMATAVHRWPMEDKPHKVTSMRCGGCGMLTLTYRPPRWEGDQIRVDCPCGYVLEDEGLAWAVTMIEKEERERQLGERGRSSQKSA